MDNQPKVKEFKEEGIEIYMNKKASNFFVILSIIFFLALTGLFISQISINTRITSFSNQTIVAYTNIDNKVSNLYNNKAFSENANKILNSTIVILTPLKELPRGTTTGTIYISETGEPYNKGTGFVVKNGYVLTANHNILNANSGNIILLWNGKPYLNGAIDYVSHNALDLNLVRININILNPPPLNITETGLVPIGSKIGFIGFPLEGELLSSLNDGVISAIENYKELGEHYFINSFVNKGNSGGPLFLSDTGEIIGVMTERVHEKPLDRIPYDENKLSEGEEIILKQMYIGFEYLANKTQVGIGIAVPINKTEVEELIRELDKKTS